MRIAIIGYGKMGHMIEEVARKRGHRIGSCIDIDNQDLLSEDNLRKHDVAIEFTRPETALTNISACLDAGLPVVSGTTGWTDQLDEITRRCREDKGSFLYASNFSLGVNILFYLNRKLATVMNRYGQYDVSLREVHHTRKLDAPSGTAISLAEDILAAIERKSGWSLMENKDPEPSAEVRGKDPLRITALREGNVPGIHEVIYESDFDTLSIRHSAKDRRGFANGAVLGAEYIFRKTGVFTMKEVLNL